MKTVGNVISPQTNEHPSAQQPSAQQPSAPQPSAPPPPSAPLPKTETYPLPPPVHSSSHIPTPEMMDVPMNIQNNNSLNNKKCMVTGKYFCIPCQCENDINKCNPYMCKCHDCMICNEWCDGKCPTNCHNHRCYAGNFYKGDAGWCCPLFLFGIFNNTVVSPLVICNNVSECECDMCIIPPLLTFCNSEKIKKRSKEITCSTLGFWGKCTEGSTCCGCPETEECHNCGFLFFGANQKNCYPFWFNHRFSNTCQFDSKLLCFKCEHETEHLHINSTEKWSKYGCATFFPYCYSHTYNTQEQTDQLCGCFGVVPLSITKKLNIH